MLRGNSGLKGVRFSKTWDERAPAYPLLWLLTADGRCYADWGTQVRFKAEGA